jgi:RNA 2',3'-cyclic 3'-phosphodiesterase
MKRIFIAVKVDAEEGLNRIYSSLKARLAKESIKWTDSRNIHLTLVFLGDTEDQMTGSISRMLKERCRDFGKFEITLHGTGVFKSIRDTRVIWAGIDPSDKFISLYETIAAGVSSLGIRTEERPFKPHLTLGRIRYLKENLALGKIMEEYRNVEIQKVPVNEVLLYESILKPSGPEYRIIGKYEL